MTDYGYGVKEPIEYALKTMKHVRERFGTDKVITTCEFVLLNYQAEQRNAQFQYTREDLRGRIGNFLINLGKSFLDSDYIV